jgi:MPBQ/MSBQ methyltransferase
MVDLEGAVTAHYAKSDLEARIEEGLLASGLDPRRLGPEDLAPVDEFHIGGRAATRHLVDKMALAPTNHVLDIGCGIGGATRYLASEIGCQVTGIDLTPDYVAVARTLAEWTGLGGAITYETASALAMPFEDGRFDAAITLHVAMNIEDRHGFYREVARVLERGAVFAVYDVMAGERKGLIYPVPWAETAATSYLASPAETAALLGEAGFDVEEVEDRTEFAIDFFRTRLASAADGPPPLGLHLLTGANSRPKFENMLKNAEAGHVAPTVIIARRR